jgi:AAA+ ATPase superfamily predicted ATPase
MDIFTTDARPFPEYLYGREDEIKRLISLVNTEDFHIALIGGMRRTGKTSLLLSLLKIFTHSKYKEEYNINDAYFPLYIEMDAVKSLEDFNSKLYNRILSNHTWRLIQNTKVEKKVKNVINCFKEKYETFKGYNLSIPSVIGIGEQKGYQDPYASSISRILESLSSCLYDEKVKFGLVVIDEFQKILDWKDEEQQTFIEILKEIYDVYHNLKVFITGSVISSTEKLFSTEYDKPMHGRRIDKIYLMPISVEASKKMLEDGFREHNINDELAVTSGVTIGMGIPGLLTYYGKFLVNYYSKESPEKAIEDASRDAYIQLGKEVEEEITHLKKIKDDGRYLEASKIIVREGGKIIPSKLAEFLKISVNSAEIILNKLTEIGFINKKNNEYEVVDNTLITLLYNEVSFRWDLCPICNKGKSLIQPFVNTVLYSCGHVVAVRKIFP